MLTPIANELLQVVEAAATGLRSFSDAEAAVNPAAEKWSKKQILGHLIDSATNNHHRFVRAQEVAEFSFPNYQQGHWVNAQAYRDRPWGELIDLWWLYNRHLAHVMTRIPEGKLNVVCRIGPNAPVTLGFLAEDYLRHLKHHLTQLGVA
jgi:hypothetical protein